MSIDVALFVPFLIMVSNLFRFVCIDWYIFTHLWYASYVLMYKNVL